MEAEADLVNMANKPTFEEEFDNLASDDEIENELAEIKAAQSSNKRDAI